MQFSDIVENIRNLFNGNEKRALDYTPWVRPSLTTTSGVVVTSDNALAFSAVYACIRVLAETISTLPLIVYERLPDGGKRRATDHYLYKLLHDEFNPEMTSTIARETSIVHLATWGNSYFEPIFNRSGQVTQLWPLRPEKMQVRRDPKTGNIIYVYANKKIFTADEILHVPALGFDGLVGYSPLAMAREAIGFGLAMETYGGAFYDNGAAPGGVLEHPAKLSSEAYKNLVQSWENRHSGAGNRGKVAILEEGLKYNPITIPPADAQFLESRKFQVREIARFFRVPPHKIGDLDNATFSNIEHQSIEFVTDTIRPWLVRYEQGFNNFLLLPSEREKYFIEHLIDGLLRGDIQSRYSAYNIGRTGGWLSGDDIRSLENMNPMPGDQGKIYFMPLNMAPIGTAADVGQAAGDRSGNFPENLAANKQYLVDKLASAGELEQRSIEHRARLATYRQRIDAAQRPIFADIVGRVLRRERNDIGAKSKKSIGKQPLIEFENWLTAFYDEHSVFIAGQMAPALASYAELIRMAVGDETGQDTGKIDVSNFLKTYISGIGSRLAFRRLNQLIELIRQPVDDPENLINSIDKLTDHWVNELPEPTAADESVRANNALALAFYRPLGIQKIRSVSVGDSCPYCDGLDGRTIGISDHFINVGDEFQPAGAEKPLTANVSKRHPPYHDGCNCLTLASYERI